MTRPSNTSAVAQFVFEEISIRGLLLQSGREFPSATTAICGEPVSGSWWSHPQSGLIHWVLEELDDHPDLISAKLINGKQTFIHQVLWPSLVVIGMARERWQVEKLSPLAKSLLRKANTGIFRLDGFKSALDGNPSESIRVLERRLLVHTQEIHTDQGKHTKLVQSWAHWSLTVNPEKSWLLPSIGLAKADFESAVSGYAVKLPW